MMDYRYVEQQLKDIIAKTDNSWTKGHPFKGKNFMTPNIVAQRRFKKNGLWFEISYGSGIFSSHIFGLTLRDDSGVCPPSLEGVQGCYRSFSELEKNVKIAENWKEVSQ